MQSSITILQSGRHLVTALYLDCASIPKHSLRVLKHFVIYLLNFHAYILNWNARNLNGLNGRCNFDARCLNDGPICTIHLPIKQALPFTGRGFKGKWFKSKGYKSSRLSLVETLDNLKEWVKYHFDALRLQISSSNIIFSNQRKRYSDMSLDSNISFTF